MAGGDGSVAAAAAVALEHGLPLAVIAAGTLNHFARDVGLETPQDTADAVVSGSAVHVDVADVNGTPFLNTASIGGYPEMVRRRDRLSGRMGKWMALTVAAAQVLRTGTPVSLVVNGQPLKVWILFIGNGCYTPRGLAPAWRPRLEDGLLDVQYLRADVRFSRTRAVLGALLGVSDRGSAYAEFQAEEVRVVSRSGLKQVAYDGEMGEKAEEFVFTQAGAADRLLLPHRLSDPPLAWGVCVAWCSAGCAPWWSEESSPGSRSCCSPAATSTTGPSWSR